VEEPFIKKIFLHSKLLSFFSQLTSRAILRSILNVGNFEKADTRLFKFPNTAQIPTVTTH
jgi:hypothetical protein